MNIAKTFHRSVTGNNDYLIGAYVNSTLRMNSSLVVLRTLTAETGIETLNIIVGTILAIAEY